MLWHTSTNARDVTNTNNVLAAFIAAKLLKYHRCFAAQIVDLGSLHNCTITVLSKLQAAIFPVCQAYAVPSLVCTLVTYQKVK